MGDSKKLNQKGCIGDVRIRGRKNIVGAGPDDKRLGLLNFVVWTQYKINCEIQSLLFTVMTSEMEDGGLKEEKRPF